MSDTIEVSETEEEIITKHAVIYTDGSSKNLTRPGHPGHWGCGLHGYIYSSNNLDNKNGDKPNGYVISDIGYIENSQLAKDPYKTVVVDQYINGYESYERVGTNNTGEITGILLAITESLKNDITTLYIKTDSTYAMHVFETVKSDPAKNWDRADLKNREYYFIVADILKEAEESNMKIRIVKVAGHSTAIGNHLADRMALLGRLSSIKYNADKTNVVYSDAAKYWKPKLERHPFLNYKQLFFTNHLEAEDGPGIYSILDFKKDDETGKKSSSSTYGLVVLNDKVPEIENVKRIYQNNLNSLSLISSLELNMIYKQNNKFYNDTFGDDAYTFNNRGRKYLSLLEEDIVCTEVYPPGLAKNALDKTLQLGNILNDYRGDKAIYTYTDISDRIYGVDEKGKVDTIITQDDKMISLKHNDIDIVLQMNNDILSRNQFKKIEKDDVDVVLVTIEKSKNSIEYFTIVHMKKTNDIIILCNFYSNSVYYKKKK
jgi:ribonuclease HI